MTGDPDDTIVALATARGVAALAILRLSGASAISIADSCLPDIQLSTVPTLTARVGFVAGTDGELLDQVVVTVFRGPKSVTGEDVVEISCHGGDVSSTRVLDTLIAAGARPAGPGEFTRRAFLNGRMDLSQAEAVADLIHARSKRAGQTSIAQIKGAYSRQLTDLRSEMLDLCGYIELELDFAEEDVEFADRERLQLFLERCDKLLSGLVASYRFGAAIRDGIHVVIGGRPNAGKSTLLNALVGFDRAIVSETPGTTRDEIEARIEYDGLELCLLDTAGLRETNEPIEAEGVRRAYGAASRADVLLYVYDAASGLRTEEREYLSRVRSDRPDMEVIVVSNKQDLVKDSAVQASPDLEVVPMSALEAQSNSQVVHDLLEKIVDVTREDEVAADASFIVTNRRHHSHLQKTLGSVQRAASAFETGASGDMIALELRTALEELGAITGATTSEDVLDWIFSRFCIGK